MKKIRKAAWKSMLIFSMFFLCSTTLLAQQRTVSGIVMEPSGEPIIGASVQVKGTSIGTITDFDGKYNISAPAGSNTLIFNYLGFKTQELVVTGNVMNVKMEENTTALDELVVIGYGAVAKKDLTGSVASVSAKDLEKIPVSNVSEALTGKLPGVSIITTEGSPDADVKIRVRGGGSLSQDNSPLYIVDGFEVSSISDVAPSEIQSIDVLKDASSTAIYGAKGANGVIIVTTKSGHEGKIQVSLGASYGLKKATKLVKTLSPYDYAAYQYELGSTDYGTFSDLDIWKSVKGNDFQDQIFGRTGNQAQYNVNISGGTKDTKYSISYAHSDEESIMLGSGYNRDNINAKINTNINSKLKFDFNARMSYQTLDGLSGGADTNESNAANSIVANSVRFRPITPLTEESDDDEESASNKKYSPLDRLEATYKEKVTLNQNYNAGLSWKITKNLTARSELGYGWRYSDTEQVWETAAVQNSKYGYSGQPQAAMLRENRTNWRNANTLTYDNKKMFSGRDKLNVLLGHEISSNQSNTVENVSVAFPSSLTISEILAAMGNGTALPTNTYIGAKENMLSFFGRANYTLMEKYLFTFTLRADGSSKFAENNRWGYFPSAAVAWRISDETFMLDAQDWLSNLKFRLSFGTAGNNRIKSGLVYSSYSLSDNTAKAPYFNEVYNSMLENSVLSNPDLKWETTVTRNFGIDYGFWNNRISGNIDLYWNTTKDLLMKAEIPADTGYSFQYQNFGQTSNKGIEFALTAILVDKKNFGLDFNFNISYNRSKIDKLTTDSPWQSSTWAGSTLSKYEDFKVEEGGRLGEVWGYKTNGFYTAYDEGTNPNGELIWSGSQWTLRSDLTDNSQTITGGSYYPGGLKLEVDENGDPLKQRLGNTVAPVYGGFGLNGRIKNFDFSAFFNYSIGNVIINGTKLATSFYTGSSKGYNLNNDFATGNRYTGIDPATGLNLGRGLSNSTITKYDGIENVVSKLNEINANATIYNPYTVTTMQLTDYAVENASFLRVNNISIGYTIPKEVLSKIRMETIRFYVTGYNLFCFTNYSGSDPEVDTSSKKNAMTPGVDYASYPKSRSFVLGINVTF